MQLALLGSGDADLQDRYQAAAAAHPGRIGVVIGYDEALAHLIQAGADALIVPSRFEPCGLTPSSARCATARCRSSRASAASRIP